MPCSGPTPDASASAMDNGRAMMATMIPATTSDISWAPEYFFNVVNNIGRIFSILNILLFLTCVCKSNCLVPKKDHEYLLYRKI